MVQAFLAGGCRHYIAPVDDPDSSAVLHYVMHLFYDILRRDMSITDAHQRACAHDDQTVMFRLVSSL